MWEFIGLTQTSLKNFDIVYIFFRQILYYICKEPVFLVASRNGAHGRPYAYGKIC